MTKSVGKKIATEFAASHSVKGETKCLAVQVTQMHPRNESAIALTCYNHSSGRTVAIPLGKPKLGLDMHVFSSFLLRYHKHLTSEHEFEYYLHGK